ncbi:alpha/beta fold hydrolase [Nocardia sp. CA-084685]|uniref:alpha/beta fold hydrolase n=1 Tax=Nocardia sp. CA-084685 TaxID=3239970 RepID=UPI003D96D8A5
MSPRSVASRKFLQLGHSDNPRHVAYQTSGAGQPVVLLHPVGLDSNWWSTYTARLAERYRVIAVDVPGHGWSSPIRVPITLDDIAGDVAAVLRVETNQPTHVIGVSMGGMIAQYLALLQPDQVASLILCATAGSFADKLRPVLRERGQAARAGMDAVIEPTLARWFSPRGRSAYIGHNCVRTLDVNDPASWEASWHAISEVDTLKRLRTLCTPTLVITGAADITTPPAASEALARALPNARLTIIPDAWHLGVFEEPQPFLAAFTAFLEHPAEDEVTIAEQHYLSGSHHA